MYKYKELNFNCKILIAIKFIYEQKVSLSEGITQNQ